MFNNKKHLDAMEIAQRELAAKEMAAAAERKKATEEAPVDEEVIEEVEEVVEEATTETPAKLVGSLFVSETRPLVGGANQLNKTAQLTAMAERLTSNIMEVIISSDAWVSKIEASQKSHDAMDDLINEVANLGAENVEFLRVESTDTIEKMLRSQQSKRSRAKSKQMSFENYQTMMVGAVAENLLRIASNKHKSSGGGSTFGDLGYSAEEIENFMNDPEELKKAIRNVQSKKSIMKSKAEYADEAKRNADPRWIQLLADEIQLKEIRDRGTAALSEAAQKALEHQKATEEILNNIDTTEMTGDQAKALLDSMKEMLASK